MFLRYFILFAFIVFFSAGCGKEQAVQDPPSIRTDLVLGLFHALEDGDHLLAIENIRRLRDLKDSTFLASLESRESQNLVIKQIQNKLDQGMVDEAIILCDKGIETLERNDRLLEIREELYVLKKISDAVNLILDSKNWREIARASAVLKTVSASYPISQGLVTAANEKFSEAKKQIQREQNIAIIDFVCDLIVYKSKDPNVYKIMTYVLSHADPLNPVFLCLETD